MSSEGYARYEGARVTTSDENSPFTYREKPRPSGRGINRTLVTDEEPLFDWLRRKQEQDLLSDDELARLLDDMEFRLDVVVDEGVRRGGELELQATSGDKSGIPWDRVEEMERIRWRTGRIDDTTYWTVTRHFVLGSDLKIL
ncbi:hypothetical protein GGP65_001076 [Salinibacter ruber]|uniref:hypothetical protein n=1 Tax=Salinibacter ruber TaxID=146919 RepID=UPI002169C114|nr:hypothetical protein [Salinibacter ruber]MCS3663469.1 hypothetical protein [Salinibacter ruber]